MISFTLMILNNIYMLLIHKYIFLVWTLPWISETSLHMQVSIWVASKIPENVLSKTKALIFFLP